MALSHTDFEILLLLIRERGRLVQKEKFLTEIWPDRYVEESSLSGGIARLRRALGDEASHPSYIETISKHGYKFIARVRVASRQQTAPRGDAVQPAPGPGEWPREPIATAPGGALVPDSGFYIVRAADEEFAAAVRRGDSIILVKGPRQVGKTSLLARGLSPADTPDRKVLFADLQSIDANSLSSTAALLSALMRLIADQLGLARPEPWDTTIPPTLAFERFLRRELLEKITAPVIWGIDEIDRLFRYELGSEVLALFRSWHNRRAFDRTGMWHSLTVALAFATEPHLFISDPNQSPFNVGTLIQLQDFDEDQVADLNRRFGNPLPDGADLTKFQSLLGGHPYLVHTALYQMARTRISLSLLEAQAYQGEGMVGEHLRQAEMWLSRNQDMRDAMKAVIGGNACPTLESFFRLRSAGLIAGTSAAEARPRCTLYASYLKRVCGISEPVESRAEGQ